MVPVPIENMFAGNEFIEQICLVGHNLPQPIGLVQLPERVKDMSFEEIKENLQKALEKVIRELQLHENKEADDHEREVVDGKRLYNTDQQDQTK